MKSRATKPAVRKRRTRQHVIADLAVNHLERHILLCGHSTELTRHDYGIDVLIFFYNRRGEVRDGYVFVQVKASERLRPTKSDTVTVRLSCRDIDYWLGVAQPMILIAYDAFRERAYWLYVQEHFQRIERNLRREGSLTVHIPLRNVVNRRAIERFSSYNERIARQQAGIVRHNVQQRHNRSGVSDP